MIDKGWIGLWVAAAVLWTLVLFPRNTSSTEIELFEKNNSQSTVTPPDTSLERKQRKEPGDNDSISSAAGKRREDAQSDSPDTLGQTSCINVNTAGSEQLQTLSGIGPVLARRIIAYRQSNKSFTQPDDLTAVKGIGPVTVEKNRNLICF